MSEADHVTGGHIGDLFKPIPLLADLAEYPGWKARMRMACRGAGWGDPASADFPHGINDVYVASRISGKLDLAILDRIPGYMDSSARDLWDAVANLYASDEGKTAVHSFETAVSTQMNHEESLTAFHARFRTSWKTYQRSLKVSTVKCNCACSACECSCHVYEWEYFIAHWFLLKVQENNENLVQAVMACRTRMGHFHKGEVNLSAVFSTLRT